MRLEKRKSERRSIRVPVICWKCENDQPVGDGKKLTSKNISATGLYFESDDIYPIGTRLLLEIHLPGRSSPVKTQVNVVRLESILGKENYLIGTTFHNIQPEDKDFVVSSLERMNLYTVINQALELQASDLHLTTGHPPIIRSHGRIRSLKFDPIQEGHIKAMIYPLLTNAQVQHLEQGRELDFAFSPNINTRFRVNLHFQRGFMEATLRAVPAYTKTFEELGLPAEQMIQFCKAKSGLLLIAGTTNSGKTTTAASMVDYINKNLERVVITIEDPIEFTHGSQKSVIKQRELGTDTLSYAEALKRTLRQDPDVIFVGELLDEHCVLAALRAAETGHLVITTVHAPDTEQTIERIVNLFPPEHAGNICQQISTCLVGVLFQTLLPGKKEAQILATELMIANLAIRNMIRDRKYNQIRMCIQTGSKLGMYTMRNSLDELYKKGLIDLSIAQEYQK